MDELKSQYNQFVEIAKALNKQGVVPVIYGSLGLSRYIELPDKIQDLDIMIENKYLDPDQEWKTLLNIMLNNGFKQDRIFPMEFTKGNGQVGFEDQEYLIEWAGVDATKAKITEENGARFRELNANDYLKIYNRYLESNKESVARAQRKVDAIKKHLA